MLWFLLLNAIIVATIIALCIRRYKERVAMMNDVHQCHGRIVRTEPIKASRMGEGPGGYAVGPKFEVTTIHTYEHYHVTTGYMVYMQLDDGTKMSFRSPRGDSLDEVPGIGIASIRELIGTMYYVTDKKGRNYYTEFVHDPFIRGPGNWL
ncbi:MAG: hypothetical protein K5919_03640 [Clostridiales bacterium]|nr:hypothetical protein [Clostridiales bacterium]